jgi:transposase-like protein
MKKSRYTEEQIAFALKQVELGTPVAEVCRKMGLSEATMYNWREEVWRSGALRAEASEDARSRERASQAYGR